MDEKPYQNIDLPQSNPLDTKEEITEISVKKTLNPKILIIIIFGSIILILLFISLITTQTRKKYSNGLKSTPTSIAPLATPTTNDSLIPIQYQQSFKQLEQSFSQDPDLSVPQIDTQIGL